MGFPEGELSILILDDSQIAVLNKIHLKRIGPTNVIAFPMHSKAFPNIAPELLGDVVISAETAEKEGSISGVGTEERLKELLVHGILHLVGFDHENNIKAARRMQKKSRELLDLFEKRKTCQRF